MILTQGTKLTDKEKLRSYEVLKREGQKYVLQNRHGGGKWYVSHEILSKLIEEGKYILEEKND